MTQVPELPGFYFDPARNRYFRILPGHNNPALLATSPAQKRKPDCDSLRVILKQRKTNKCSCRIADILQKRTVGILRTERNILYNVSKSCLAQSASTTEDELNLLPSENILDIVPNTDHSKIGCVTHSVIGSKQCVSFVGKNDMLEEMVALGSTCDNLNFFNVRENEFSIFTDVNQSTVTLLSLRMYVKVLKQGTPFACAGTTSPYSKHVLSYSDGKKSVFVTNIPSHFNPSNLGISHPAGGVGCSVVQLHQDILAQCFARNCKLHYNGLRGGEIVGLDLREKIRKPYSCKMDVKSKSNVKQIMSLNDGRSLIVAYRNPRSDPLLYLWDARFPSKHVLDYPSDYVGNADSYQEEKNKSYKLRMNIDKNDTFLCCVLPDFKVRIWSVKTGENVVKYPAQDDTRRMTSAAFSTEWKLMDGLPGLIIGEYDEGLIWKGKLNQDRTGSL